jgi:hypothetical protein
LLICTYTYIYCSSVHTYGAGHLYHAYEIEEHCIQSLDAASSAQAPTSHSILSCDSLPITMFSPAGIIIYKGTSFPHRGTEDVLMIAFAPTLKMVRSTRNWRGADDSLRAYTQDDDMHSPRIPDYEKGRFSTSIRKRCRLHLSGESTCSLRYTDPRTSACPH